MSFIQVSDAMRFVVRRAKHQMQLRTAANDNAERRSFRVGTPPHDRGNERKTPVNGGR